MVPTHTNVPSSETCRAVNGILVRIGVKWSAPIDMSHGDRSVRFKELKRRLDGISQRMARAITVIAGWGG